MLELTDSEQNKIAKEIDQYAHVYPEEKETANAFAKFVLQNKNCLSRSCDIGHLTTSAWVENKSGTRFLLTKHKKLKMWLQLGGHVENSNDLLSEALREVREESGLENLQLKVNGIFDLGLHLFPGLNGTKAHYHYDVRFLLTSLQEEKDIKISDESDDLKWFEIIPSESDDLRRMFIKWKNR